MRAAALVFALVLAACGMTDDPVGIPPSELYTLVCVDSILVYPTYPCTSGTTVTITIANPFQPTDTTEAP